MKEAAVQEFSENKTTQFLVKANLAPSLLFLGTISGLVLHTQIEQLLGLEKNSMLIGVAVIGAGFMDNVLAVTLWTPIVFGMGEAGVKIFPLWWAMLFGGTFTGTLTYVGSTAGIVAVGIIERQRLGHITLGEWIKAGISIALPTYSIVLLLLYLQIPFMPG